jgi:5'-nucleotidase
VDAHTGALSNCQGVPNKPAHVEDFLRRNGKVYQGGNAQILHTLLGISSGENLLYVGDHIFADMLRSKRSLGWRTCLVVPELEREAKVYAEMHAECEHLAQLKRQQELLEAKLDALYVKEQGRCCQAEPTAHHIAKDALSRDGGAAHDGERVAAYKEQRQHLEEELMQLRRLIVAKFLEYDAAFHPRWGQVTRT